MGWTQAKTPRVQDSYARSGSLYCSAAEMMLRLWPASEEVIQSYFEHLDTNWGPLAEAHLEERSNAGSVMETG